MGSVEYMHFSEKEYRERCEKARELMKKKNLKGLFITEGIILILVEVLGIFHIVDRTLCFFPFMENQLQLFSVFQNGIGEERFGLMMLEFMIVC